MDALTILLISTSLLMIVLLVLILMFALSNSTKVTISSKRVKEDLKKIKDQISDED